MIALLNPKTIIACVLFLALGYGCILTVRVSSLKKQLASVKQINISNAKELETVKANYTKTVIALENYIAEKSKIDIQIKAIKNGKPTDIDRPASPMLSDMFIGVRNYYKDK